MNFDPQKHHRRSIRLQGYDYSSAGAYFVTVVAWQREILFGEIVNEEMVLKQFGEIVADKWRWLETQYPYVELGAWVVMPNHFHGILAIHENCRGDSHSTSISRRIAPTLTKRKPLGGLIGVFKTEGQVVWQRNCGACPELVEGNISFVTSENGRIYIVTSNPTHPCGRRMRKTQIV